MAVYRVQDTSLTAVADAIRAKAGTSGALTFPDGFVEAVGGIQAGGGGAAGASPKEVNFYDYDGTLLHAYTVAEARRMAELPAGPTHKGLVFQGWNWSLEGVKGLTRAMNIGAMYTTDDGTTRLYITLQEGRTSPMLGICVNGTVTVDWGDGTEPDVLTGTNAASSPVWTSNHAYAAPGDYVIRLTINGSATFTGGGSSNQYACVLRHSSEADGRNSAYQNALQRVEIGENMRNIGIHAFSNCRSLASVTIPDNMTGILSSAFTYCYSLASATIPDGVTKITSNAFAYCYSLALVTIPDSVTEIENTPFTSCYSLASVTIPNGVTSIGSSAFYTCYSLASVTIPNGVTEINGSVFINCYSLASVTIPNGVTTINSSAFSECRSLNSLAIPGSVTTIARSAFQNCYSVGFYDFTACTAVPTLSNTNAFSGIPADCEIRVPAALYDEWVAATNWATYASYIKAY